MRRSRKMRGLAAILAVAVSLLAVGIALWLEGRRAVRTVASPGTPAATVELAERSGSVDLFEKATKTAATTAASSVRSDERSNEVRVVLRDAADQKPLDEREVVVSLRGERGSETRRARSDAAGELALALEDGPIELRLDVDGYVSWSAVILPEQQRDVIADLARGATLDGIVIDSAGNPLAASLRLFRLDGDRLESARTRSFPDGSFELRNLVAGRWRLTAVAAGHVREVTDVEVPSEPIAVRLRKDPGFSLRVLDPEGNSVSGAHVAARARASALAAPSGRTDSTGRVRLNGVDLEREGTIPVVIEKEGYPTTRQDVALSALRAGEVMLSLPPSIDLRGRVVSPTGVPVRGATVRLEARGGRESHELRTISSGKFHFRGVAAGAYRIRVSSSQGTSALDIDLEDRTQAESEIEIVLERETSDDGSGTARPPSAKPGSLSGWILTEGPLDHVRLELRAENDPAAPRIYRFSSGNRRFRLRRLTPGAYTVALKRGDATLAEVTGIEVRSGEATTDVQIGP